MKNYLLIGSLICGTAVLIGAFGAHGLKEHVTAERLDNFETGVKYQFYHGLALLFLGTLSSQKWIGLAAKFFLMGVLIFPSSLYLLVLTDITEFGAITPIGGVSFIMGWICLAIAAKNIQARSQQST